jgi:hypothetical protein
MTNRSFKQLERSDNENEAMSSTGYFKKSRSRVDDIEATVLKSMTHLKLREEMSDHNSGQHTPLSKETVLEDSEYDRVELTKEIN